MVPLTQSSRKISLAYPSPLWRALAAQIGGLVAAVIASALWAILFGAGMTTLQWVIVQSVCAAAIAATMRMPWWWVALNLAFVPALAAGMAAALSPYWSAAALLALVLVYGGTQRTRVPLYLSNTAAVRALREVVPLDQAQSFLDIGAGTGTVLAAIAHSHPYAIVQGVERAPMPFLLAFLRGRLGGLRYRVRWANLWTTDLSRHDVVYAYLSPAPMAMLWEKARREMRPGSLLVSYRFVIPDVVPDQMVYAGGSWLYVWRLP